MGLGLAIFQLFLSPIFAAMTITDVSGASSWERVDTQVYIRGGMADGVTCTQPDGEKTCDTCAQFTNICTTAFPGCNTTSVYDSLVLKIYYKTDKTDLATANTRAKLFLGSSTSTSTISFDGTEPAGAEFQANSVLVFRAKWGALCGAASSTGSTCSTDFSSQTFTIGIDKDADGTYEDKVSFNLSLRVIKTSGTGSYHSRCGDSSLADSAISSTEGVCHFEVSAGDGKVFVRNTLNPSSNFPKNTSISDIPYSGLRVFHAATNDFCGVSPASESETLPINSSGELADSRVGGLDNDVTYSFLVATVDKAGNVAHITCPTTDTAICPSNAVATTSFPKCTATGSTGGVAVYGNGTDQCATPGEVSGLLDEQKCFVATAAFGDFDNPVVRILRQFRSEVLVKTQLGRVFVHTYLRTGPQLANWIRDSELARKIARVWLWVPSQTSQWLLSLNLKPFLSSLIFLTVLTVWILLPIAISIWLVLNIWRRALRISKERRVIGD